MSRLYKNKYRIDTARLRGWDYRNSGGYFVTICTRNKEQYFGSIKNGVIALTDLGKIAYEYWGLIPDHTKEVTLGEFMVMPNHLHGIVILRQDSVQLPTGRNSVKEDGTLKNAFMTDIAPWSTSLSAIIRSYKSAVTKWAGERELQFAWQSRFHDHIIRDDDEFVSISNYIINNPRSWKEDKFFTP